MKLKDIKVGGRYSWRDHLGEAGDCDGSVEVIAYAIKPPADGYGSRVLATSVNTGEQFECDYASLTPWDQHLRDEKVRKVNLKRTSDKITNLAQSIGGGAVGKIDDWEDAVLLLSEEAAGRILGMCGAKPLPEERRPSLASDRAERYYLSGLLSQRIRKALGCGQSGYEEPDDTHQASIFFYHEGDLDQAIDKLGAGQDPYSGLAELLG